MATKKQPAPKKPARRNTAAPLETQPQSKQAAAQQAHIYLHTDDAWSNAYWTSGDLHCEERVLFG